VKIEVVNLFGHTLSEYLILYIGESVPQGPSTIPTYAIHALKSRVALYFGDWSTVTTAAETVIRVCL